MRGDHTVLITYLVMAGVMFGMFVLGNVIWQHWYCGSPITECRAFAAIPCEPISGLEAQRSEYVRLAKEPNSVM